MGTELNGLYRGFVRDNVDPEGRFRLRVQVPLVSGEALSWAEACLAPGHRDVPDIGDSIWVMFEGGDQGCPVWLGVHPTRPS